MQSQHAHPGRCFPATSTPISCAERPNERSLKYTSHLAWCPRRGHASITSAATSSPQASSRRRSPSARASGLLFHLLTCSLLPIFARNPCHQACADVAHHLRSRRHWREARPAAQGPVAELFLELVLGPAIRVALRQAVSLELRVEPRLFFQRVREEPMVGVAVRPRRRLALRVALDLDQFAL